MNRAQRRLVSNFLSVTAVTLFFVFAVMNVKDLINRKEAMRGMKHLGEIVLDYRNKNGALPGEAMILDVEKQVAGSARLGEVHYRAQYISINSTPDTIVAYDEQRFGSLLVKSGFIVLMLDGRVQFMDAKTFYAMLSRQQSEYEIRDLQEAQQRKPQFGP
jgi:hypothetical protein